MLYIAVFQYFPNSAPTNRIMAYIKAISELGVKAKVVFFLPDKKHSRVKDSFPNIEFEYLWDRWLIDLPRLNKLSLRYYIRVFVNSLCAEDCTFVYGFPDLVVALGKRPELKVFSETTEHPKVSFPAFIKGTTIESYINACQHNAGLIVISKGLRDYFISKGCEPERIHIVNMTVDKARFETVECQPSKPYIAYCGTASNTKDGVDQLIKAFAIVVKKHPDSKLYIIGGTPSRKQRFGNLELVKDLGIERSVVFTGIVSSKDIPQMLKNAKALALDRPDNLQAKYGFPTKLGEYLLTGNPVVVTRVGDLPLFLEDGVSALMAEPGDPHDFAEKLCWAIEHPDEARVIGERGKKVAEIHFNSITETRKLLEIVNR